MEMQAQRRWAIVLIKFAALCGFIGTIIGSVMSGQENYALRPVHAHVELVGWLSVFAWGIFYYTVPITKGILVKIQAVTGLIGAFGLSLGMYLYNFYDETWTMVFFIVGGTILLLAFFLFFVVTFFIKKQ